MLEEQLLIIFSSRLLLEGYSFFLLRKLTCLCTTSARSSGNLIQHSCLDVFFLRKLEYR